MRSYTERVTPDSELPDWPGQRIGLPESGSRSVARIGRRIGGIAIDWGFSVLISAAFFSYDPLATIAIFAGLHIVSTALLGGSPGHLILGMHVVPMAGGRIGLWRPILRTALLVLVLPAVFFDVNHRGLHDRAAGTVLLVK